MRSPSTAAVGAVVCAALCGVLAASAMLQSGDLGVPTCLFHFVTTLPCPSCGMTRAFVALGHGEFAAAARWNTAAFVVFPMMLFGIALAAAQAATGREWIVAAFRRATAPICIIVVGALAVAWALNLGARFGASPFA